MSALTNRYEDDVRNGTFALVNHYGQLALTSYA